MRLQLGSVISPYLDGLADALSRKPDGDPNQYGSFHPYDTAGQSERPGDVFRGNRADYG